MPQDLASDIGDQPAVKGAADANRLYYAARADSYDREEACYVLERERNRLKLLLRRSLAIVDEADTVLDACGGSGNASELLAEFGLAPVLTDISPEMISLWKEKARRYSFAPETHESEIEAFLVEDPRHWDLIVFCQRCTISTTIARSSAESPTSSRLAACLPRSMTQPPQPEASAFSDGSIGSSLS